MKIAVALAVLIPSVASAAPVLVHQSITTDDYPPEAFRHHWTGTVGYTLAIGADGSVGTCTVTQSSGHAELDEATCRVMTTKATFRPAIGSDGRPEPSTYSQKMVWGR